MFALGVGLIMDDFPSLYFCACHHLCVYALVKSCGWCSLFIWVTWGVFCSFVSLNFTSDVPNYHQSDARSGCEEISKCVVVLHCVCNTYCFWLYNDPYIFPLATYRNYIIFLTMCRDSCTVVFVCQFVDSDEICYCRKTTDFLIAAVFRTTTWAD